MKILCLILCISFQCFAKDLPQDMRLDSGSLVMLQQYIEAQANAEQSFPVFVNFSCAPKMKGTKISNYKCKLSEVKYATKEASR